MVTSRPKGPKELDTTEWLSMEAWGKGQREPLQGRSRHLDRSFDLQNTLVNQINSTKLLEQEMATHSRILAWRIPRTEEPGRLWSMGLGKVRHDWLTNTVKLWLQAIYIGLPRLNSLVPIPLNTYVIRKYHRQSDPTCHSLLNSENTVIYCDRGWPTLQILSNPCQSLLWLTLALQTLLGPFPTSPL